MKKARAIVINEKSEVYVCNLNGSYVLPGGTIENKEKPLETLIRELKEELGLSIFDTIDELINIDYYHNDFPKYTNNGFEKRLNSVFYYVVFINSKNIGESKFTEYEKGFNDKIEVVKLNEIDKLFKNCNFNNKWINFTNLELKIILDYFNNFYKKDSYMDINVLHR